MDTVENLLGVLADGRIFMDRPSQPPQTLTQSKVDINLTDLVVSGNHVHAFAVGDDLWGNLHRPKYFRPGEDMEPWLYVFHHFGLTKHPMIPGDIWTKLNTPQHTHIMDFTDSVFNLKVMCILATHAQETPYIHHFSFHSTTPNNIGPRLEATSNRWFRTGDHEFPIYFGGQALAHVLLGNTQPASQIEVWVETAQQVEVLVKGWRQRYGDALILGTRPRGVIVACLPRTPCSCVVRVVPPHQTYHELWKLHPDFTQCVFDGTCVIATPRCLLAVQTHASQHPPNSTRAWMSKDSGLSVDRGVNTRGKPTVIRSDSHTDIAWELLTQFGCTGVSLTPSTDPMLFTPDYRQEVSRLGFGNEHIELKTFLENPQPLEDGVSLFMHIDRMYVETRLNNNLYVRKDPSSDMIFLELLMTHLNSVHPGKYQPTEFVEINLVDTAQHAANGEKLPTVPIHTSISGTLWWNPMCVNNQPPHTLFFNIMDTKVHPPHLI
jgi:hypothetical protein